MCTATRCAWTNNQWGFVTVEGSSVDIEGYTDEAEEITGIIAEVAREFSQVACTCGAGELFTHEVGREADQAPIGDGDDHAVAGEAELHGRQTPGEFRSSLDPTDEHLR